MGSWERNCCPAVSVKFLRIEGILPSDPYAHPKEMLLREGRKMKAIWVSVFVYYRLVMRIRDGI